MNQTTTHRAASVAREPAAYSDHITEELHRYEEHLRDVRGLVEGSCRQRTHIIGRLLHKKFAGRPIDIVELRAEDVRRFLANQLDALRTPSNALQLASALRSYFVIGPPAVIRSVNLLPPSQARPIGSWPHCRAPSSLKKQNAC